MKVLFGVRVGEPDYCEVLITEREESIPAAMDWAKENGLDRLRIADIDLSVPPDFSGTVQVKS